MSKACKILVIMVLLSVCLALPARQISAEKVNYLPGKVLVKFKTEYKYLLSSQSSTVFGFADLDRTLASLGTTKINQRFQFKPRKANTAMPDLSLIYLVEYDKDITPQTAAELLMQQGYFQYTEPEYIHELMAVPDDPYYATSSYLAALNAETAWDVHQGQNDTTGVIIAIVDTGVRWWHPDLKDNIRINPAELTGVTISWTAGTITGGNGIDDDGNGFVDDVIGWDFMLDAFGAEENNPSDGNGHGTRVAGLADARTNNAIGVSALPWNVKLMPISCSYPGSASLFRMMDAFIYASDNGADVINYSAGSSSSSQVEEDVINYVYGQGTIIVAAAGNMNNQNLLYPAAYPKVVAVGAVQNDGIKTSYSSYGGFVDVCAPMGDMYSTENNGSYSIASLGGYTSYASPVAAGLTALVRSAHHDWSNDEVVNQVIATCADIDGVNPTYANLLGDGMLNAYDAVTQVNPLPDQELRLALAEVLAPSDANGNLALEPDETFSLNLKLRNYTHGVSSSNVTYTLSCDDPDLIILNSTHLSSIAADGYTIVNNAFECQVSPTAVTKTVVCTLTVAADLPVTSGSVLTFSILLNAGGVFVWEGKAEAGYSGRTIRNYLQGQGHSVHYTTLFPFSFSNFSAVFLSYGMVSNTSFNVTRFDRMQMFQAVKDYLEEGGRIYIEGNDAVGFDLGYFLPDVGNGQSAADVLWPLLGIVSADDGTTNGIDNLAGEGLACTHDIVFTATTQTKLDYMDKFVPSSSGAVAFTESDYGIVAIQNYGSYGQKSFVFSYCLAELTDGTDPNTRYILLNRIMQDFTSTGNNLEMEVPLVTIEKTVSSIAVSWDAVPFAQSYRIEASDEPETGFTEVMTTDQTSWEQTGIQPKEFYKVIARSVGLD